MHKKMLWITETAVMLALLISLQALTKSSGQLVTGSFVNAVLAVTALTAGLYSGITVAIISPILAYLLSMSIFSAIHVAGYVGMTDWLTLLLCFFQYLPASFALAWSYHRSGSIFTSVLTHTVVNLIGKLAMR